MPRFFRNAVPLNLSGFACRTTARTTFLPVTCSAQRTDSSAAEGKNWVSIRTRPVGPSIQYEAVEKPQVELT